MRIAWKPAERLLAENKQREDYRLNNLKGKPALSAFLFSGGNS
jgi:hypothetical protein